MKLAWFLIVIGGGYLLFRVIYAIMWGFYSIAADPWYDVPYMLIQAFIIGGVILSLGIWRLVRQRAKLKDKQNPF